MKRTFKEGDTVRLDNINLLDRFDEQTGEEIIKHFDRFRVLEVIDYGEGDCDLVVQSLRNQTKSIIDANRFIKL